MARSDRLFKNAFNQTLDRMALDQRFDSISALAKSLDVSRNTARRIVTELQSRELLLMSEGEWTPQRMPQRSDYFPEKDTQSVEQSLESAFMEWLAQAEPAPGTRISEAFVARMLNTSTSSVRELLIKLSRFGFLKKEPQRSWVLEGFTRSYAAELHEVRLLFEVRAIEKLIELADDHAFWPRLAQMLKEHEEFLAGYEELYLEFPKLDASFHRLLNTTSGNRFIESFQDAITLIFHYHYRWNKNDEKERNRVAAQEHVDIIKAILDRDTEQAKRALRRHLATAEMTLKNSVEW